MGNNSVVGGETVDDRVGISREDNFRGRKGGFKESSSENGAANEAVHSTAGIIAVEGNQAVERLGLDFLFEEEHFGFRRFFPKLAI